MSLMLTELCGYLRNWFDVDELHVKLPGHRGKFTIREGVLYSNDDAGAVFVSKIVDGQYYRITGSVFNNGVHQHIARDLKDEVFEGRIQAMAIPEVVIALADQIEAWRAKFETVDSQAMSPFNSESFGGYSYSKGSGGTQGTSGESTSSGTWQGVFGARLRQWKKL